MELVCLSVETLLALMPSEAKQQEVHNSARRDQKGLGIDCAEVAESSVLLVGNRGMDPCSSTYALIKKSGFHVLFHYPYRTPI